MIVIAAQIDGVIVLNPATEKISADNILFAIRQKHDASSSEVNETKSWREIFKLNRTKRYGNLSPDEREQMWCPNDRSSSADKSSVESESINNRVMRMAEKWKKSKARSTERDFGSGPVPNIEILTVRTESPPPKRKFSKRAISELKASKYNGDARLMKVLANGSHTIICVLGGSVVDKSDSASLWKQVLLVVGTPSLSLRLSHAQKFKSGYETIPRNENTQTNMFLYQLYVLLFVSSYCRFQVESIVAIMRSAHHSPIVVIAPESMGFLELYEGSNLLRLISGENSLFLIESEPKRKATLLLAGIETCENFITLNSAAPPNTGDLSSRREESDSVIDEAMMDRENLLQCAILERHLVQWSEVLLFLFFFSFFFFSFMGSLLVDFDDLFSLDFTGIGVPSRQFTTGSYRAV